MKLKSIRIILIALVLVVMFSLSTIAATDYQVALKVDKQIVHPGDTVKVTVSLANINVAGGLGAFQGKITYDASVFEDITQESITALRGWGTPIYNPEGGYVTLESATGTNVTENTDMFQVTLKVKSNAEIMNANFEVSGASASNGESDFIADNSMLTIPITAGTSVPGGNNNNLNTNDVTNNGVVNILDDNRLSNGTNNNGTGGSGLRNNTVYGGTNTNSNTNTGSAGGSIPYAGANDYVMPIILLIAIAIVSYIGYKKLKNV